MESRKEREQNIREHSEVYGTRWCLDNSNLLYDSLVQWHKNKDIDGNELRLRVYNRVDNRMTETPLKDVLLALPLDQHGKPAKLRPTPFGQVSLSPTVHISTNIYILVASLWDLAYVSS